MATVDADEVKRQLSEESENPTPDLETTLIESVLRLEEIDNNLFRASEQHLWKPVYGRSVFGGQVVGQSVVAAGKSIPSDFHLHSLHCYFVRPGNPDRPIIYHVEDLRNGLSFGTRIVKAQQQGDNILTMLASYHKVEPSPVEHQYTMPVCAAPEELRTTGELYNMALEHGMVPSKYRPYVQKMLSVEVPTELKPVYPELHTRLLKKGPAKPKNLLWIRVKGDLSHASRHLHMCIAAYMSDYTLLGTSLLPTDNVNVNFMASLDHSMWFHTSFRADEWMLYEVESPRLNGCRAFTLGRLWKRDGTLAVSVAQEGVVRLEKVTKNKL